MGRLIILIGWILVLSSSKVAGQTLTDATLFFFTGRNFNAYTVYQQATAVEILRNPNFNSSLPTVLYIHGLNESPTEISVQVVINAYLLRGGYNVILLNWQTLADQFYPISVYNVARLGTQMATVLGNMFSAGLSVSTFHLVGHSLGGQMSGYIGRNLQSQSSQQIILPRISALDPAGPLYYPEVGTTHIRATDALFVDIIHTDAGFLGAPEETGTVDFWPNSGSRPQPGCPTLPSAFLSADDRCSHSRSWRLWAESVISRDPLTFLSAPASNWEAFQVSDINVNATVQMGLDCPLNISGNYYLQTNGNSPYSLGESGIYYH